MEKIYASNSMEYLAGKLAGNIREAEGPVFGKIFLVTQSAGMNAWLKNRMARENRVFANFEFLNQEKLFAWVYRALFGTYPANNQDRVKYRIYELLAEDAFAEKFKDVSDYFKDNDLRRFQLAVRVADLFDQYQVYRPGMISDWDQKDFDTEKPAEAWQRWLWQKLELESRAATRDRLFEEMKKSGEMLRQVFPHVSLFGISIYTDFHLEFFRELARYTRVDFYLNLPTGDKEFRNELLQSYGFKARELAAMFEDVELAKEDMASNSLLGGIQKQILENQPGSALAEDNSIVVNSCHTPAREAECVYNYLLDLFERNPDMVPGDVLIMCSDIGKYAPLVKAVFRNAPVKPAFVVSGMARKDEDSMVAALEQILSLTGDDLGAENVIGLLDQKRIKKRFRIVDTTYLRTVVRKANIRFGYENNTDDDSQYVSWSYGLKKFLLGYAMLSEDAWPLEDDISIFPFRDAEDQDSYDLLRLKAFVDSLVSVMEAMDDCRSLEEWKKFLLDDVLDRMIFMDDYSKEDRQEMASINRVLAAMDEDAVTGNIPFRVFMEELKSKLFLESRDYSLSSGNITVSSPVPVRGLPHKVICFLGMDNGVFPRKDSYLGFDLLGEEYREGDRSIRETDKYLFLDTLLSARERLYLSFVGQDVKDNSEIPPSIVLDTLMNYLDRIVPGNGILKQHPLHGFSKRYRAKDARLFSYLNGAHSRNFELRDPSPEEYPEIQLRSFTRFFEQPIEWYFKEILGVKYEEEEEGLPEREMTDMNGLDDWQVKHDLLDVPDDEYENYSLKAIKEGKLPLKTLGEIEMDRLGEKIMELKPVLAEKIGGKKERSVFIDLKFSDLRIYGDMENVYERQYVSYALSDNFKYKLRAKLNAVILYAAGEIDSAIFYALKKQKIGPDQLITEDIPRVSKEVALEKIGKLVTYFKKGLDSPLKMTPGALQKTIDKKTVKNVFEGDYNAGWSGRPPDPYVIYLYRNGLLDEYTIDPFDKDSFDASVYDRPVYEHLFKLADLLNLN